MMSIDIQILLTFYLFMFLCVASNDEMSIKEFKSQVLMILMSGIGWALFKVVEFFSGLVY